MPPPAATTYTDQLLRSGDSDRLKRWGGAVRPLLSGTPVCDLQQALIAVGVLDGTADGAFGGQTEQAVRRFQWNVRTLSNRLIAGSLQFSAPNLMIAVTGQSDAGTAAELQRWVTAQAQTTGSLVCADAADYASFTNECKRIDNPSVSDDDMVVDSVFLPCLTALNDAAVASKVGLFITQAFRVSGVPVTGAVVTPATSSQHLIGNAIDCNIGDGTVRITSDSFKNNKQTPAATKFVTAAKASGLRWGGDFQTVDYVHFDNNIAPHSDGYLMRYYFNQRVITKRHPIPDAVP